MIEVPHMNQIIQNTIIQSSEKGLGSHFISRPSI